MSPLVPLNTELETGPTITFALLTITPHFISAIVVMVLSLYFNLYQLSFVAIPIILIGIYQFTLIQSTHYYLTKQQIIVREGIFSKSTHYLELYRIKDISVSEPFILSMMGMMNIELITFDINEPNLKFRGIYISSLPQQIRDYVQNCRQNNKIISVDR